MVVSKKSWDGNPEFEVCSATGIDFDWLNHWMPKIYHFRKGGRDAVADNVRRFKIPPYTGEDYEIPPSFEGMARVKILNTLARVVNAMDDPKKIDDRQIMEIVNGVYSIGYDGERGIPFNEAS